MLWYFGSYRVKLKYLEGCVVFKCLNFLVIFGFALVCLSMLTCDCVC